MNEFDFVSIMHIFIYARGYEIEGELFNVLKNSS